MLRLKRSGEKWFRRVRVVDLVAILITAVPASCAAVFSGIGLVRKKRLEEATAKLEKKAKALRKAYQEFGDLYLVEGRLLELLEDAGAGKAQSLKTKVRKEILGNSGRKITLTAESVKNLMAEL